MVHQRKGAPWGIWPVGQAVKTPASHAGNAGSIPARVTNLHSRGDWKRGCHSAKQSQTASFAKRNSLGRSRRGRSCVTNFPHRLTRNRTREGFGRVRKAQSGFPAKGAQQLAASRADCKAGCRFPHGSPIFTCVATGSEAVIQPSRARRRVLRSETR